MNLGNIFYKKKLQNNFPNTATIVDCEIMHIMKTWEVLIKQQNKDNAALKNAHLLVD